MKLPKSFTDDCDFGMCYEKKAILHEQAFFGDIRHSIDLIHRLLQCMKDSNNKNEYDFPFYQLRVRPTRIDERPEGICFELRWGNREDLEVKE